jgi:hypothetical protein
MKLELLTNATIVNDSMRFIAERIRLIISSGKHSEESKEPDFNHDSKELEDEQEKGINEIEDGIATNQVF